MEVRMVTPYLVVDRVPELLAFLSAAFGAKELTRFGRPDGSVQHAEVMFGSYKVMMGQPNPGVALMPATMHVDVSDVDVAYARALRAGGASLMEPVDRPPAGRMAGVKDPAGNHWYVASLPK